MPIRISTKVEEAWYVDPELLAGEEDAQAQPVRYEVDTENPLPRDVTVALGEGDMEELNDGLRDEDEDARHYRDVSLRGALLVDDNTLDEESGWLTKLFNEIRALLPEKHSSSMPGAGALSRPPAPPGSLRWKMRNGARDIPGTTQKLAVLVAGVFEPGKVPPILLATLSFFAGVIATLLGVLLAL